MKKVILVALVAAMCVACGPSREERIAQIEDFEDSVFEMAVAADPTTADEITELYVSFAKKYPTDSLAPQYLLKAAEAQGNVMHTERSIELFDYLIDNYPDFEDIPVCYFLKGTVYESNSQYEEAIDAYETYLELYPDHYFADMTRQMLPRVGMSPDEMLSDILANANDTIIAQTIKAE